MYSFSSSSASKSKCKWNRSSNLIFEWNFKFCQVQPQTPHTHTDAYTVHAPCESWMEEIPTIFRYCGCIYVNSFILPIKICGRWSCTFDVWCIVCATRRQLPRLHVHFSRSLVVMCRCNASESFICRSVSMTIFQKESENTDLYLTCMACITVIILISSSTKLKSKIE